MNRIDRDPVLDRDLACKLIERLNDLLENEDARIAIETLIGLIFVVPHGLAEHPTIQVWSHEDSVIVRAGLLGILNGIVGSIQDGPRKGWGYIAAHYDEHRLVRFELTQGPQVRSSSPFVLPRDS